MFIFWVKDLWYRQNEWNDKIQVQIYVLHRIDANKWLPISKSVGEQNFCENSNEIFMFLNFVVPEFVKDVTWIVGARFAWSVKKSFLLKLMFVIIHEGKYFEFFKRYNGFQIFKNKLQKLAMNILNFSNFKNITIFEFFKIKFNFF